jgi:hypothetical protein
MNVYSCYRITKIFPNLPRVRIRLAKVPGILFKIKMSPTPMAFKSKTFDIVTASSPFKEYLEIIEKRNVAFIECQ